MTASLERTRSIDDVLAAARSRITRYTPEAAWARMAAGALLVDTRPEADRLAEGAVPGAVVVELIVLEWRLDPQSDFRIPEASHHGVEIIVLCNEGYSSSLAADRLHDLGLVNAGDVIGGFRAWAAAGLPTVPGAGILRE